MLLLPAALIEAAPASAPARAMASLVKIQARLPEGDLDRVGGGVVVAPGLVATNAHVAALGRSVQVVRGAESWMATGIRIDPDLDLCLLTVPGLPLPPAEPGPEWPEAGEEVFAVGFPGGHGLVVSRGHLRAVWYYRDGRLFQSDVETHPGSSGGGLFDVQGRLLGLTTFTAARSPRLSFSLSLDGLRALEARPVRGLGEDRRPSLLKAEDYLSALAQDPRNEPTWESGARAWVAADPRSPDAWFALGLALDQANRRRAAAGRMATESLQEAIEAYRRAIALRPDARALNNLGAALDAQNRFSEAEPAFEQALELEPDYVLAWMNLGSSRLNAQKFREAAEAFRQGLARHPDDVVAWTRLAQCCRKLKDWEGEVRALEVALRYRPLAPELWLDYGAAQAHLRHRPEAEAALRKLEAWDSSLAERLRRVIRREFRSR